MNKKRVGKGGKEWERKKKKKVGIEMDWAPFPCEVHTHDYAVALPQLNC
jgi:hypothetical protein